MSTKAAWIPALTKWYRAQARALPWRENHDPYRIWISEVMLQQTQVTTVIPYFHRFLERFPTLAALAASDEPDVLAHWSGLGYYSRAKNLRKGAQTLVEKYGGKFPRERDEILDVPGIGPYTAGAILSIAFDLKVPLVDGNVQRVFARLFAIDKPLTAQETQKRFWDEAAQAVAQSDSPRDFNQALMELGATVCTKGTPRCPACPIGKYCLARKQGRETELPLKKVPKEKKHLWWAGLVLESKGEIFLHQNGGDEWWAGMWDLPRLEADTESRVAERLSSYVGSMDHVAKVVPLPLQKHTVTHHKIQISPYLISLKKRPKPPANGRWFPAAELNHLPISSLVRKVIREL